MRGFASAGKLFGRTRMIGGKVAEAVIVGSLVRVGQGVGEIVGVGVSCNVGQGVAVFTGPVGKAKVGGNVGKGAIASSITSQLAMVRRIKTKDTTTKEIFRGFILCALLTIKSLSYRNCIALPIRFLLSEQTSLKLSQGWLTIKRS